MTEEKTYLTFEEAKQMLPDGDTVHTFRNTNAGMLVGTDWSREGVLDVLKKYTPELSGEMATRMKHGICIKDERGFLFIETKERAK